MCTSSNCLLPAYVTIATTEDAEMTPRELSLTIGVDQRRIREVLRAMYRPNGENKNARWVLDDQMIAAVRRKLGR